MLAVELANAYSLTMRKVTAVAWMVMAVDGGALLNVGGLFQG
jgi:hypothetical protein